MNTGHFYFIKDIFYNTFTDCGLMNNKGVGHSRPCFYCFSFNGFFWMIPISSKVEKYEHIYAQKMKKYASCDSIHFAYVNGQKRAFLLQNIFPVSPFYVEKEYRIQNGTVPVTINSHAAAKIHASARKLLRLSQSGHRVVLTDISKIMNALKNGSS